MTTVHPAIRCSDYWPHGIPKDKLRAYKAMIDAGQITKPTVTVNRSAGSVSVDYFATVPQEWIRQEMARISNESTQEVIQ